MTAPAAARLPLLPPDAQPPGEPTSPRRQLGVLTVARAEERSPLPLAGIAMAARVAEGIAQVTVTETFHNPYADPLEAVYVFPLPGGAAVTDFELRVGTRVLRGEVREREEARRRYREALAKGHRAALLEQERDDVFTVQVGNLPPGEEVTVRLEYCERLPRAEDGRCELRLPVVVAPRYVPGMQVDGEASGRGAASDTDLVPDASRVSPPRLAPGFDPRVALGIEIELLATGDDAGWKELACSQHATRMEAGGGALRVALARDDEPLDRDFVLRWRIGEAGVRTSLLLHRAAGEEGGFALLSVVPPAQEGFAGLPRDVVFLFDRSGSMEGVKLVAAARACSALLATLGPRDRFAIQAFDDRVEWLSAGDAGRFVAVDAAAVGRGEDYLRNLAARGGTELDQAVGAALGLVAGRGPEGATRAAVLVVLTDGQIADEHRVLVRLQASLGEARVFTVGIDTAVNEAFLSRLAALGGGTSTFVEPGTAAVETALVAVAREIGTPLVVDLTIDDVDAGLDPASRTPERMPDLFAGRVASAMVRLGRTGSLRLRGRRADGGAFAEEVAAREVDLPALGHLWARARVRDLEDRYRLATGERRAAIRREIVDLALAHRILTRFTAFVVVDEAAAIERAGNRRSVVQPVAMPAQWAPPGGEEAEQAEASGVFFCADIAEAPAGGPPSAPAPAAAMLAALPPKMFAKLRSAQQAPPKPSAPKPAPRAGAPGLGGMLRSWLGHDDADELAGGGAAPGSAAEGSAPVPTATADETARRRAVDDAVTEALDALRRALDAAHAEVAAGRVPAPEPLAAARQKLLAALATWPGAGAVPELQRLLRAGLLELVAACATPGVDVGQLKALLDDRRRQLEVARAEVERALGTTAGEPAWERTI